MARIRTIKPEFFTSEQIVECSTNARLLFVGLLCFCDDAGRHPASAKRLKMEVFPGDSFSTRDIEKMLDELIKNGLVLEYRSQDQVLWQVTGWERHQKVERPTVKYRGPFDEGSTITRRGLATESNGVESSLNNTKHPTDVSGEVASDSPAATTADVPVMEFPTVGKGPQSWVLTGPKVSEYELAYPGVDVLAECRKARQWCIDNAKNRKTAAGMPAFLSRWLSREQNRTRGAPAGAASHPFSQSLDFGPGQ